MRHLVFSLDDRPLPEAAGFRSGLRGTHSSRTLMINDLAVLLDRLGDGRSPDEVVVEENALGKPTVAGRRMALQRLNELYGVGRKLPMFEALAALRRRDVTATPQLALLVGLARDPLLRATARVVVGLTPGSELMRDHMRMAIQSAAPNQLNDAVLDKVVRNVASSWVQAGYLEGRVFKRRRAIEARTVSFALALKIAFAAGFRGESLFSSGWVHVLDLDTTEALSLAERARAAQLIGLRRGGDGLDVSGLSFVPVEVAHV